MLNLWLPLLITVSTYSTFSAASPFSTDAAAIKQHLYNVVEAWNKQQNFSGTQLVSFKFNPSKQENSIPLTLVIDENSGWESQEVIEKLVNTRDIYEKRCQIHLNPVLILKTKNKNGPIVDENRPGPYIAEFGLEESGMLMKPVFYFVNAENKRGSDRAGGAWALTPNPTELEARAGNSGFLYRSNCLHPNLHSGEINAKNPGVYEVLAHELGHILMQDEGHSQTPGHFMSEDKERTNFITDTQCNTMKTNIAAMKARAEQERSARQGRRTDIKTTSLK